MIEKLVKTKKEYDVCNYGNGHESCSHSYYCIFNPLRIHLEEEINETFGEYLKLKRLQNSYNLEYFTPVTDYDFLVKKIELIRGRLLKLIKYRSKVLKGEVNGYGALDITKVQS